MKSVNKMMLYWWIVHILVTLGIHKVCCIKLEYVWPLGELSGAREALADAEVNYPIDTLYVGDGHPSLSYRALSLEAAAADDNIIVNLADNLTLLDFTFSLYFFPIEPSGPVFTYQASNVQSDGITGINVTITDAVINVSFSKSPNELFFSTTAHTVEMNQWNFLAFERNYDTGVIKVFNATSVETGLQEEAVIMGSLGSGKIKFGSNNNQSSKLFARFTCAALYGVLFTSIDVTNGYEAFSECADPSTWMFYNTNYYPDIIEVYPPNTDMPESPTTDVTTSTDPPVWYTVKVWPLNNVSFGFSSLGKPPVYPENSECFRTSDDGLSLLFDGSSRSYLEQTITVDEFQHQLTVGMFLKPGFKTCGTVFQFVGESATIEAELFIDGRKLTLILTNSTSVCGTLKSARAIVPGTWNYVRVYFKNNIVVDVNGTVFSNTTQCNATVNTVSGRLLLGANINGRSYYRGEMRCFVVFQGFFHGDTIELHNICQANISIPAGINMSNCNLISNTREISYGLEATNAKPSIQIAPMKKVKFKTVKCAKLCLETRHCLSFVTKRKHGVDWCYLYDVQTDQSGLVYAEKAKYFIAN